MTAQADADARLRRRRPVRRRAVAGSTPRPSTPLRRPWWADVTYDRATPGVETVSVDTRQRDHRLDPDRRRRSARLPAGRQHRDLHRTASTTPISRCSTGSSPPTPVRFDGTVLSRLGDLAAGTSAIRRHRHLLQPRRHHRRPDRRVRRRQSRPDQPQRGRRRRRQFLRSGQSGLPLHRRRQIPRTRRSSPSRARRSPRSTKAAMSPWSRRACIHGGSVRVNGVDRLCRRAKRLELRVNQGLFDIIVDRRQRQCHAARPHRHRPAARRAARAGDNHRIYMVAVPKNQAITAILEGSVGFDDAVVASVENGAIVLSAGYSVVAGNVDRFGDVRPGAGPRPEGELPHPRRHDQLRPDRNGGHRHAGERTDHRQPRLPAGRQPVRRRPRASLRRRRPDRHRRRQRARLDGPLRRRSAPRST